MWNTVWNRLIISLNLSEYSSGDPEQIETLNRILLLYSLLASAFFFEFVFIFISFSKNQYALGLFESIIISVIVILVIYLRRTQNYFRVAIIFAIILAVFFQYLLFTGGVDGNGYIWSFLFPVGVMFYFGYKTGLKISLLFLFLAVINILTISVYSEHSWGFKPRFLAVYTSLMIIAYVYEFTKQKFHFTILQQNTELLFSKKKAENADRLKTEFLAQMSHEIRTPINTILNYVSLLELELKDNLPDDLGGSFNSINNASNRLIRTIDLILDLSAIESGSYEPVFESVNFSSDIIKPIMEELTPFAQSKNLQLIFTNNDLNNEKITVDKYTMSQTISNLVHNALKYTNNGTIEINCSRHNSRTVIKIMDTGIGISEEFLPHLFEKFSQETQGYSRIYEGNGLGLALVKEYCKINNAELIVESEKGKGTTFTVTL